jgi:hypothetical protein
MKIEHSLALRSRLNDEFKEELVQVKLVDQIPMIVRPNGVTYRVEDYEPNILINDKRFIEAVSKYG